MKPIHLAPLDETGHPLPPIEPSSDVAQLLYLLETARQRGYRIGPTIRIGNLVTSVVDLRQTEGVHAPAAEAIDHDFAVMMGVDMGDK